MIREPCSVNRTTGIRHRATVHGARAALFLALRRAGTLIRQNIDRSNKIQFKGKNSINLVTWVDQAADKIIRDIIRKRFPDHNLLTEESVPTHTPSPYKWIIDPLDGTTNYAHHFPQVGVSIGLEYKGKIILGGVYDPFRDELFGAEKGRGAWMEQAGPLRRTERGSPRRGGHRRRLTVSPTPSLSRSLLLTGFPYDRRARVDLYLSYVKAFMQRIQGIRRAGAAALDLCWIACGRVDGYWEWRLKPWDVAAGMLIVEEAGGRLSDFSGKPFGIYGEQTLATNGKIHKEMLRVMRPLKR